MKEIDELNRKKYKEILEKLVEEDRSVIEKLITDLEKNSNSLSNELDDTIYDLENANDEIYDLEKKIEKLEYDVYDLECDMEDITDKFPVVTLMDVLKLSFMQEIWSLYTLEELELIFNWKPGDILKHESVAYKGLLNKIDELENELYDTQERLEFLKNDFR